MRIIEDGFLSKWVIWIVILMGVGICWLASVFSSSWVAVIGLVIGSIEGGGSGSCFGDKVIQGSNAAS